MKTRGLEQKIREFNWKEVPEWAEVLLLLGLVVALFMIISLGYGFRTVNAESTCAQQVSICRGIQTENGCIGIQQNKTFYDSPQQCSEYETITSVCGEETGGIPVQALEVHGKSCNEWSQAYDIQLPEN